VSETRKLAAILAADVVGYSRLAGMDEDRTLARLRALRSDLIDPTIAVHHGRIVKRTGDGVLVEFRSVVDAVAAASRCKMAWWSATPACRPSAGSSSGSASILATWSRERRRSDGRRRQYRARLEGSQLRRHLSFEDAYRQVKSRLDLTVRDLGHKQLKNIFEPIRIYSVQVNALAQTKRRSAKNEHCAPATGHWARGNRHRPIRRRLHLDSDRPGVSVGSDAPADHAPIEPLSPTPKAEARLPIVIAAPQSHSSPTAININRRPRARQRPCDPLRRIPFRRPRGWRLWARVKSRRRWQCPPRRTRRSPRPRAPNWRASMTPLSPTIRKRHRNPLRRPPISMRSPRPRPP